jgi:apolipoprotein N-acyltransferase
MKFQRIAQGLPSWKNALLAVVAGILLVLAFPDFELWFLAWFALVPLLIAVEREKRSTAASFICGWLFGFTFFTGSCWWLTYAPIHYAAFPVVLAYFLLCCVTGIVAIFPGLFAAITSILLKHFGSWAYLAGPFVWVATEFARYWITGNDWNAIGYSQAFMTTYGKPVLIFAEFGGSLLVGFLIASSSAILFTWLMRPSRYAVLVIWFFFFISFSGLATHFVELLYGPGFYEPGFFSGLGVASIVAIQPNVPMAGLDEQHWKLLRDRQIQLAQQAIDRTNEQRTTNDQPRSITVVLPESPMNYQWEEDPDFQTFISAFAAKNNLNVLFNSAEPDRENNKYFNSAVMIDANGREVAEYDKIYLLPFGEAVPTPLENILPGFVGNFSYGRNYSLVPLGQAKAGIMICFESHFGQLSREYVRRGADAIIEMTNDGYLGPTPVLRQHLANAVFRAVETNRPVLRVTNVGITAYITPRGEVLDPTQPYTEDTRVWSIARSDGSQTFYVKYGDWFAWLCSIVTIMMLVSSFLRQSHRQAETRV